jgi:hypothetical protein
MAVARTAAEVLIEGISVVVMGAEVGTRRIGLKDRMERITVKEMSASKIVRAMATVLTDGNPAQTAVVWRYGWMG